MNLLVTLAGAFALLVVLLAIAKFMPSLLEKLGEASDAGADSGSGGPLGEGSCGGDGD